ncbi:MFS transporter, partial [Aeromonas veronii]|nr:MFS transporter [Aeromonas veronii]
AILNAFMSPINGRLFDKFGGRILATLGLGITTITTYLFSQLTFETSYMYLLVLHAVRMFGMSMVFMPVSTNGLNQLPRNLYPHGTAVNNTLNQVSAAIGTGFLITLMSLKEEASAANLLKNIQGQPTEAQALQIQLQAMLDGINFTFFVSTFLIFLAFILAFFMKRAKQEEDITGKKKTKQGVQPSLAKN